MRKLLIANRGEIAVRIIRACRALGIPSVAVYSDDEVNALHVRLADESVRIGPPPPSKSYLNPGSLVAIAHEMGADAIHPGYGFLSENAGFANACYEAGIRFVGPPAEVIERMGDKLVARTTAADAGVPVVPGTFSAVTSQDLARTGAEIGYPVMVKAAAGGGGMGIRVAHTAEELAAAMEAADHEARAAFGEGTLYLEKRLVDPRHIEVQILADEHGNAVHLFDRECSIQRRRQKVVEEAPASGLSAGMREDMAAAALRLCRTIGYVGAGTVEFLVQDGDFYFLEMNTRIQVEHPVTEEITQLDLVREQIRIAYGEPMEMRQEDIGVRGCALEFRINAEDPDNNFLPSPGRVTRIESPGGPGVRVESGLYTGCMVQPYYDPLVAKLVVWADTRQDAIGRARAALWEFRIGGIGTNLPLHRRIVYDDTFISGRYHTGYLDDLLAARTPTVG